MEKLDHWDIVKYSKQRAKIEIEMCKQMYAIFNSNPIITMLRDFIRVPLADYCARAEAAEVLDQIHWVKVMRSEAKLGVWRFADAGRLKNADSLEKVIKNSQQWTAADCSDLIRLFGAFVENKALLQRDIISKDLNTDREGKRPGPGFKTEGPDAQRGRDRDHYYEKGQQTKLPHVQAAHHTLLKGRRNPEGFAGFEKCTLKDYSTVKKIDAVFGLGEGCGISGTTADSIFFMQYMARFLNGLPEGIAKSHLPLVQLLPVATMGSQGHHTVLECALTLTLNHVIDYAVGFYTSLTPKKGSLPKSLKDVFEKAEFNTRRKHIICFFDPAEAKFAGVRLTQDEEIRRLRRNCVMKENFRNQFSSLNVRPSRTELCQKVPVIGDLVNRLAWST